MLEKETTPRVTAAAFAPETAPIAIPRELLTSVLPWPAGAPRTSLAIREVAELLRVTRRHVLQLIEEYRDTGGRSGLAGIDIARRPVFAGAPGKARRRHWRIPVSAFEHFLHTRSNDPVAPSQKREP